ncbi:MAG: hypothetical protein RR652_06675, partial [Mucinivorans sp.]
ESLQILSFIQDSSGLDNQTDVIWGAGRDENLGDEIRITVVATGFDVQNIPAIADHYKGVITPPVTERTRVKVPQREVIDFEAPEVPLTKKVIDPSADGFEVVTRQAERIEVDHSSRNANHPMATRLNNVERKQAEQTPNQSPDSEPKIVDPNVIKIEAAEDTMIQIDDQTIGVPAYMRRGFVLYNQQRDPTTRSEKLDQEASANRIDTTNVSLFDQ